MVVDHIGVKHLFPRENLSEDIQNGICKIDLQNQWIYAITIDDIGYKTSVSEIFNEDKPSMYGNSSWFPPWLTPIIEEELFRPWIWQIQYYLILFNI